MLGSFCNCDLLDEAGKGWCIKEVACNACNREVRVAALIITDLRWWNNSMTTLIVLIVGGRRVAQSAIVPFFL